jgi:NAD(P)-dependent dehydrogenase (short-subunit alcohol dehydrogenase family)
MSSYRCSKAALNMMSRVLAAELAAEGGESWLLAAGCWLLAAGCWLLHAWALPAHPSCHTHIR